METIEIAEGVKKGYEELDQAVAENNLLTIKTLLNAMHSPDISDYLEELKNEGQKATLFRLLRKDHAVDVFEHLEYEEQDLLINSLRHERVIEIIEEMSPDDRTELFEEMPARVVKKFLAQLSPEERITSTKLLGYAENSVGRLMTTEYVAFRPNITVRQAIDKLKAFATDKETIYHSYIIDETRKLIGYVSLKMLIMAEWEEKLGDLLVPEVIALEVSKDQEAAALLAKHYDVLALPVVDTEKRLVGIVTFDDLVDVMEEEATEDIQMMAAIVPEEHPYFDQSIWKIAAKRIPWLALLLVVQIFSSFIITHYEHAFEAIIGLSAFIPMLMSTGGNTGNQSSAMVIRGLAVGEIKLRNFLSVIRREFISGLMLGVALLGLGYAASFFVIGDSNIAIVVGISISLTVMVSAVIGGGLPLFFRAIHLDPALMSGPFITTLVDIIGLIIYFETFKLLFAG
jgi:magnesium transporter